jgi:hypothetical protein
VAIIGTQLEEAVDSSLGIADRDALRGSARRQDVERKATEQQAEQWADSTALR